MADTLAQALAAVRGHPGLGALQRGIEKESLRVTAEGELSQAAHPQALGSPLTHPHITTDFSEAQLELITGVHGSADAVLAELAAIHRFVAARIGGEALWAASMPCRLPADEDIPIARFGTANAGRCKTIYRLGLSHRYGRRMQAISGIHYNFSLPPALWPAIAESRGEAATQDFVTDAYFGLIRNFRRYSWLLIYLFGAAPAVAKSFAPNAELPHLDAETLFAPAGTSLRMGRLGYQSAAQDALHISYNSLAEYAATMRVALTTPYPAYAAIGVGGDGGDEPSAPLAEPYRQLSTALLQIENEFYGTIRPKRRTRSGERPLQALGERGVEYVEVRCLDLDPFLPLGIDATTCRFLDVFLLLCLLADSPPDSPAESAALAANQLAVVARGREPALTLQDAGEARSLRSWATAILERCQAVAAAIDGVAGGSEHAAAVAAQLAKVEAPERTPSAGVIAALRESGEPFTRFALRQSQRHRAWLLATPLTDTGATALTQQSERSLDEQSALEAAPQEPFATYLRRFLDLGDQPAAPGERGDAERPLPQATA